MDSLKIPFHQDTTQIISFQSFNLKVHSINFFTSKIHRKISRFYLLSSEPSFCLILPFTTITVLLFLVLFYLFHINSHICTQQTNSMVNGSKFYLFSQILLESLFINPFTIITVLMFSSPKQLSHVIFNVLLIIPHS